MTEGKVGYKKSGVKHFMLVCEVVSNVDTVGLKVLQSQYPRPIDMLVWSHVCPLLCNVFI